MKLLVHFKRPVLFSLLFLVLLFKNKKVVLIRLLEYLMEFSVDYSITKIFDSYSPRIECKSKKGKLFRE